MAPPVQFWPLEMKMGKWVYVLCNGRTEHLVCISTLTSHSGDNKDTKHSISCLYLAKLYSGLVGRKYAVG